jgi:hypothetical protein
MERFEVWRLINSAWKTGTLLLVVVLSTVASTQKSSVKTSAVQAKQEQKWAARTHTSTDTIHLMLAAAGLNSRDDFEIENLDLNGLRSRKQVLLSTWDYGTGHCLTVYVLRSIDRNGYDEIFETDGAGDQNFCTESVLGGAHAYLSDGRIIVQMPTGTQGGHGSPFNGPKFIELSCSTFVWNGHSYVLDGSARKTIPAERFATESRSCG